MSTIPANSIVSVNPNVLEAGGSALDMIGLLLTSSARVPIGAVPGFASASDVGDYFGLASDEKAKADVYFAGFEDSTVKPGSLLFAQYNAGAVSAWLRGGDVSALTTAELQAINGALSVTIDGVVRAATVNLSTAVSFSSAAFVIAQALGIHGAQSASVTGSIAGTTLTVSAVSSGTLGVGSVLSGTGVTAATYISALGTGTGGVGTYTVSTSQTAGSQAITAYDPAATYDSVSGAFQLNGTLGATSTITFASGAISGTLKLTEATGAVLSQGTAGATPAAFMTALTGVTTNWATFATLFDPDETGNDNKMAFAEWNGLQNRRYVYVCWDPDLSPSTTDPATSSMGHLIEADEIEGTCLIGQDQASFDAGTDLAAVAAFVCGAGASVDFSETNGRITFAFKSQSGLAATVTNETAANNLGGDPQTSDRGNGYNFYGAYATANDQFTFFNRGMVSGDFRWLDSYLNAVWLNNSFQLALVTLLTTAKAIPYNAAGRAMIEASAADVISAGLNFGAFRAGVALSASQVAQVNADAGVRISDVLQQRGWYFQVKDASATVRAARGTPPCKFWYMDGQSVQAINLASINVQ